ncbi:hypothetical protein ACWF94_11980, partial [Streptomyces sp. NPDC055078]
TRPRSDTGPGRNEARTMPRPRGTVRVLVCYASVLYASVLTTGRRETAARHGAGRGGAERFCG